MKKPQGTSQKAQATRHKAVRKHGRAPTHYQMFKNVIGIVKDMPPDFSTNHDHYLYGALKRK